MPITLTVPMEVNPGRGAPAEVFAEAKIVGFEAIVEPADRASTTIRVQYGNTVDGVWVASSTLAIEYVLIEDRPAVLDGAGGEVSPASMAYSDWVAATNPSSVESLLYVEVAIALYTYLLTQAGFAGTIS